MKRFIIKLKSGSNYIAEAPENWDFPTFVRSISATGYWCDPMIYIALDAIAFMMPMDGAPTLPSDEQLRSMQVEGRA